MYGFARIMLSKIWREGRETRGTRGNREGGYSRIRRNHISRWSCTICKKWAQPIQSRVLSTVIFTGALGKEERVCGGGLRLIHLLLILVWSFITIVIFEPQIYRICWFQGICQHSRNVEGHVAVPKALDKHCRKAHFFRDSVRYLGGATSKTTHWWAFLEPHQGVATAFDMVFFLQPFIHFEYTGFRSIVITGIMRDSLLWRWFETHIGVISFTCQIIAKSTSWEHTSLSLILEIAWKRWILEKKMKKTSITILEGKHIDDLTAVFDHATLIWCGMHRKILFQD